MTISNSNLAELGIANTNPVRSALLALGLGSRIEHAYYYGFFERMPLIQPPSRRPRIARQLGLNWYADWNQDGSTVQYVREEGR